MFTSFSVTARDGMRVSAPGALNPAPDVHVALSYDFGDFAFIQTSAGSSPSTRAPARTAYGPPWPILA